MLDRVLVWDRMRPTCWIRLAETDDGRLRVLRERDCGSTEQLLTFDSAEASAVVAVFEHALNASSRCSPMIPLRNGALLYTRRSSQEEPFRVFWSGWGPRGGRHTWALLDREDTVSLADALRGWAAR